MGLSIKHLTKDQKAYIDYCSKIENKVIDDLNNITKVNIKKIKNIKGW